MSQATHVLVFETTHHALWSESIAKELLLGVEVVPAPPEARAACDLALEVLAEDLPALLEALRERAVAFRVLQRDHAS